MNKTKKQAASHRPLEFPGGQRLWEAIAALLLVLVLVAAALALRGTAEEREATAARKRIFAVARVTDVLLDNGSVDAWTEGRRLGEQYLEIEVISGPYQGTVLETYNYMNAYNNIDCKVGSRIIVRLDFDDSGELYVVSIPNHDRGTVLAILLAAFAAVLVLVGGKKGAMALAGLIYTVACIWYILVPAILRGASPMPATIGITALTTGASLLLLTGFTRKTLCATLGCVGGVTVSGIFASIAGLLTPINGFNMSEAEELVLRAYDSELHISGLLVCGILIASLGAVMDVAMSIASACQELLEVNPTLTKKDLFHSGMNIGRDAMGTMANTLILAFAGASLNVLILVQVYDYPLIQIVNTDAIVIEMIRGISGSIGIIMTVPIVAFLSACLMGARPKK